MKSKYFLLTNILFAIIMVSHAQTKTYQYTYDDAGNRIMRDVVYVSFRMAGSGNGTMASSAGQEGVFEAVHPDTVTAGSVGLNISLYPNPTVKGVSVEYSTKDLVTDEVRILDDNGKVVYENQNLRGNFEVPFEPLAAGQYFIWLKVNGRIERFAVIKE